MTYTLHFWALEVAQIHRPCFCAKGMRSYCFGRCNLPSDSIIRILRERDFCNLSPFLYIYFDSFHCFTLRWAQPGHSITLGFLRLAAAREIETELTGVSCCKTPHPERWQQDSCKACGDLKTLTFLRPRGKGLPSGPVLHSLFSICHWIERGE